MLIVTWYLASGQLFDSKYISCGLSSFNEFLITSAINKLSVDFLNLVVVVLYLCMHVRGEQSL